jgi:hypothetical protein
VGLAVWDRGGASIRNVATELAEEDVQGITMCMHKDKGERAHISVFIAVFVTNTDV